MKQISLRKQLSEKAIKEFKKIYYDEFGNQIDNEEANERGLKLLAFMSLIYKPIPKVVEHH